MSLANYSESQKSLIEKALASVGHTVADMEGKSLGPQSHKGPMIMSFDPSRDNVGSKLVKVESIQHLKQIAGVPDSHFENSPNADRMVHYPKGTPRTDFAKAIERSRSDNCALESLIHPDDHKLIDQAMHAYMRGNSAKVKDYEPVINALRFPTQGLVATALDITISPANPLIIGEDSPYVHDEPGIGAMAVFGTLTIEPGGQIQVLIPVTIQAAKIISN